MPRPRPASPLAALGHVALAQRGCSLSRGTGAGSLRSASRPAGPGHASNRQAGNRQAGNRQAGNRQAGNRQAGNRQAGNRQAGRAVILPAVRPPRSPGSSGCIRVRRARRAEAVHGTSVRHSQRAVPRRRASPEGGRGRRPGHGGPTGRVGKVIGSGAIRACPPPTGSARARSAGYRGGCPCSAGRCRGR